MDKYREGSDIDLCLIGETISNETRSKIYWSLDDLNLPYSIDLGLLHQIDNVELIEHIKRVGKALYTKNKSLV